MNKFLAASISVLVALCFSSSAYAKKCYLQTIKGEWLLYINAGYVSSTVNGNSYVPLNATACIMITITQSGSGVISPFSCSTPATPPILAPGLSGAITLLNGDRGTCNYTLNLVSSIPGFTGVYNVSASANLQTMSGSFVASEPADPNDPGSLASGIVVAGAGGEY